MWCHVLYKLCCVLYKLYCVLYEVYWVLINSRSCVLMSSAGYFTYDIYCVLCKLYYVLMKSTVYLVLWTILCPNEILVYCMNSTVYCLNSQVEALTLHPECSVHPSCRTNSLVKTVVEFIIDEEQGDLKNPWLIFCIINILQNLRIEISNEKRF